MSHIESKKPSLCDSDPLNRNTISRPLTQLNELAKSCYGPSGRLKQVHNGMGGCICTTSASNALLSKIPFSHSILKLLSSCVLNHTSRFSDCGLFTTIFCCSLIENLLKINSVPSNCGKIFTHFLNICLDYLNADYCRCKLKVDFGSSKTLLAILRSLITSKPACMLTVKEADHITALVLRAFLLTIPDDTEKSTSLGRMIVIPLEGQQLMDSAVFNGLLVELPKCQDHKQFSAVRVPPGYIKVALFGISMAGELSDVGDGTLEVICDVHPEKATLDQLLVMARQLVNDKVGLVMCQKVIHPACNQYLQGCHVIVIDRIGVALMDPLVQVTGASAVGSFQNCIPSTCYGRLMDVCCLKFGSKQFLHLIPCSGTVSTLVLCSRNETSLNELKRVCHTAEHVLQLTLRQPLALLGGGCTETHLASYVRHQSKSVSDCTLSVLDCSRFDYQIMAGAFCHSLDSVARALDHDGSEVLIDDQYGHCWMAQPHPSPYSDWIDMISQCGCGMHKKQEHMNFKVLGKNNHTVAFEGFSNQTHANTESFVLDCFAGKCNALQVAVETANLILELKYVIKDTN